MMSTHPPGGDGFNSGELVARATWDAVERGQILGLTHALGNHAHAIELLTACLIPDSTIAEDIVTAFREDATRYSSLVALYRLLPFAGDDPAEAGTVGDPVRHAVELFRLHASAKDVVCAVSIAPDVPAIHAPPTGLVQALLVLLACSIRSDGEATTAAVAATGDADSAVIEVRVGASVRADVDRAAIAARWLLRTAPAVVEPLEDDGHMSVRVTLPSLARARGR